MIAIGVARPSAHGQAMISTEIALNSANARRGSGPHMNQPANDEERHHHDGRNEPCGNSVGQALNRRPGPLRFRDHAHDLRKHRLTADTFGAHDQATRAINRARR